MAALRRPQAQALSLPASSRVPIPHLPPSLSFSRALHPLPVLADAVKPSTITIEKRVSRPACATTSEGVGKIARAAPVSNLEVEALLDTMKWDNNGLVVAIAQHVDTGAVLMQGFANRDAVSATMASRRATFHSRSRASLWTKGETSSNFIHVLDVYLDCDRDSIIYLGKPDGPTCHTGAETCYYTCALQEGVPKQLVSTLYALESIIAQRKAEEAVPGGNPSWTKRLLESPQLLCSKIREEADELCQTIEGAESKARTVSEMADVLYHSMVLLSVQDVKLEEVVATLRDRFSQSGVEEKKKRSTKSAVSTSL